MMTAERAAKLFNGTYTVVNRESGEHRTFRVETQAADAKFAAGKRIVSLLTGPNNGSDYTGFGFVDDDGIHVWAKRREKPEGKRWSPWEVYAIMLWDLAAEGGTRHYESQYAVRLAGTCLRCNRTLTTPDSIERGIGPICAGLS